MSGDDQALPPGDDARSEVTQPSMAPMVAPRRRLWSGAEVWLLGVFSVIGAVGFIVTFALLMMRGPSDTAARAMSAEQVKSLAGPAGERGPPGPPGAPGARGPAGDTAIRVVRVDCSLTGNCTAECAGDEILLSAYCSPTRGPVVYPSEQSAACRLVARGKVEVVAACLKTRR
jgi:hypothetical protein